jgi:hypothetical protein
MHWTSLALLPVNMMLDMCRAYDDGETADDTASTTTSAYALCGNLYDPCPTTTTISSTQPGVTTNLTPYALCGNLYDPCSTTTTSTTTSGFSISIAQLEQIATIVNSSGTFFEFPNGCTTISPQITPNQYILVAFAPLIIAILYTIPWQILDNTIQEMEPFYQLQRPEGALAEHSLCLDYMTSLCVTTPFKALYRGHFFVFCSSLIYLLVLLLAPLSAETLFISLSGHCEADSSGPCHAIWGIYPLLGRIVEGILCFIAALVLLLILFNFSRHSGVYAEPLSIAGLATLFRSSATLGDFRAIDSQASNSVLKSGINYS